LHPEARPRIISDNGPQFIAKDFKEYIRISGMAGKSNAGTNRSRASASGRECRCRWKTRNVRRNSAIGCITPKDMLAGRQAEIHAERDRKLEEARKQRQVRLQKAA
jgi:hypothetical protein